MAGLCEPPLVERRPEEHVSLLILLELLVEPTSLLEPNVARHTLVRRIGIEIPHQFWS